MSPPHQTPKTHYILIYTQRILVMQHSLNIYHKSFCRHSQSSQRQWCSTTRLFYPLNSPLLTWFGPRHVWISLNATNTSNSSRNIKHSPAAPLRVFPHPQLVFYSSAHWWERRSLFPSQHVHPQLSSLTTAVKSGRFGSENTKGKSNRKVTFGWKNDWFLRCRRSGLSPVSVAEKSGGALLCFTADVKRKADKAVAPEWLVDKAPTQNWR